MPGSDVEVVVVGGGAAGIAAARRLCDAGVDCLVVEARPRLGGRAWTVTDASGFAWISAAAGCIPPIAIPGSPLRKSRGPRSTRLRRHGRVGRSAIGFPRAEQDEFQEAMEAFFARLEQVAANEIDVPAAAALEPGCRWNGLINAISTYISGAEWDRVSAKDFDRYADSGVNWRVVEGLGSVVAAAGADLPVDARLSGARHRSSRQASAGRDGARRDRGRSGHRHHPERAAGEGAT